jgi:hypothetical protein
MKAEEKLKERVKELVNDPIFDKPIQVIDYSKRTGDVKLITKIR